MRDNVDNSFETHEKRVTLGDLFEAFEEVSCFSLRVNYLVNGQNLRLDYIPTLSCFKLHKVN